MLQTIRERTQGWIAGTIISTIILTFALWGIHSYFVGNPNNTAIAVVNGVDITKEQLTVSYERLRRQLQAQYGTAVTSKDEPSLKDRALKSLIEIQVLKQASIAQKFLISDQQIDSYLESMPDFQVDGQFSLERFQEILSSTLLSTSEFLELIKTNLLIDQPRLGIMLTSFALPEETTQTIALVNQERDVDYISIPVSYFLAQPIVISPDKIQAYYDSHQSEFMTPEQVNVDYVELSLKDLYTRFTPTEPMLKSFYNENINSYTQPMAWKLTGILIPVASTASGEAVTAAQSKADALMEEINKGADFGRLAKRYEKPSLDSGMLALNEVPAELQKTAAGLTKRDQVAEPVRTSQGFVILKAVEVREPTIESFDTVKNKVRETYIHQHAEEKFAELRDQLADLTYEHPDSLQFAAKSLGLSAKTSELFTRDKSGRDIAQYKKVRDTAFSNDVMNLQNNSDVIQLNPETVIVIRVKSHIASTLLPLKDISRQIGDKLKTEEAESRAAKFADDLRANLVTGADPQKTAAAYKLAWTKAGYLGRYATKVDSAILDAAFRLPHPSQDTQTKVAYGVTRLPSGYAIVAVKGVRAGESNDKQFSVFSEQVQNSQGYLEYVLYKNSQMQTAKIKLN